MEIINKMIEFYKKAVIENYYNFQGRAGVGEFWWFYLANLLISFVIGFIAGLVGLPIIGSLYTLAVLLPSVGAAVRRLHDMGKNGWWILIPLYNIWLLIQKPVGPNQWGQPSNKI